MIHDPVAGKSYALNPAATPARSMQIPARYGVRAKPARASSRTGGVKTEDLGTQVIQGVSAQGKRVTRAIPAGKGRQREGNRYRYRDLVFAGLQVVVMSKTSDPRFGETCIS
jgi:hypothetical protein